MFSVQGFLIGQSRLHDKLQTPQRARKISYLQPRVGKSVHHTDTYLRTL